MSSRGYGQEASRRPDLTSRSTRIARPGQIPLTSGMSRPQGRGRGAPEEDKRLLQDEADSRRGLRRMQNQSISSAKPQLRPQQTPAVASVPLKSTPRSGFGFRGVPATAKKNDEQSGREATVHVPKKKITLSENTMASSQWPLQPGKKIEDTEFPAPPTEDYGFYPEPTVPILDDSPAIIPELDRYRNHQVVPAPSSLYQGDMSDVPFRLNTFDLPSVSSGMSNHSRYSSGFSGYSASPSTRFSESPGPGPYSRDTTPTSICSQSPGFMAPMRLTPRMRQGSPVISRPPVTRRRMGSDEKEIEVLDAQGLPSLRESLTSSSSNSTVKGSGKDAAEKKKKKRLSPTPPSPPPRKSSAKYKENPLTADASPPKPSRPAPKPSLSVQPPAPAPVSSHIRAPSSTTGSDVEQKSGVSTATARLSRIGAPPRRPSRDGTSDISELSSPVNVVQSNLMGVPHSADRRFSQIGAGRGSPSPQLGTSPRPNLSRLPSRTSEGSTPTAAIHREATPAPKGLGIVPDLRPTVNTSTSGLRTPSPSTATTPKHRFGLFGRRTKTAPADVPTMAKPEKPTRKGPAAGTGHEGYGRYAPGRGRASISSRERSLSNVSMASTDSYGSLTIMHDPFLSQRMSPVIITGGGEVSENYNSSIELARTESNQSLPRSVRPSLESKISHGSSRSNLSNELQRVTLFPSALPRHAAGSTTSLASKMTVASETTDGESHMPKKTLAVRRSLLRLNKKKLQSSGLPEPIQIPDTKLSGLSSQDLTSNDEPNGGRKLFGKKPAGNKLTKRATSPKRWNIFHRKPKAQPEPVEVVIAPSPKPVPYYAMIDSDEQDEAEKVGVTVDDLKDIMRDAEVLEAKERHLLLDEKVTEDALSLADASEATVPLMMSPDKEEQKVFLPEASRSRSSSIPKIWRLHHTEAAVSKPRLEQVGRIPKVVPTRLPQTSPMSFSRPFARVQRPDSPSQSQPLGPVDTEFVAKGPSPEKSPSKAQFPVQPVDAGTPEPVQDETPFLRFSPRKSSETATTSSGSGVVSSYDGTTAVIPQPTDPLDEDEVWNEFDDLTTQEQEETDKVPPSATSSHGIPFQFEDLMRGNSRKGKGKQVAADVPSPTVPEAQARPPSLGTTIRNALRPTSDAPTTPGSFNTERFSTQGDRNSRVLRSSDGRRSSFHGRDSFQGPLSSRHSKSGSMDETRRPTGESSGLDTIKESIPIMGPPQESPQAQVNLRVGSLTVSKWLTFGHVLFSPARESLLNVEPTKHHSVLVIDGLGNDDWSFFAAETHPDATFYNLSPTPNRTNNNRMSMSTVPMPARPPNHRQVQHFSLSSKFPFTPNTFTVVVLRFPVASSETLMRHVISESKRVLKAGGYLEMSVLDLDMRDMGPKTRRAMRNLKINVSLRDPDTSLSSTSDTLIRLANKRGFASIKSCNVGVPVATSIIKSDSARSTPDGSQSASQREKELKKEVSLADLMKDQSAAGDEGITKMVAKVGRWWFTRCYESKEARSIFADEKVVDECERWGTSFKLCVAYAQKSEMKRRNTANV